MSEVASKLVHYKDKPIFKSYNNQRNVGGRQ
jgi:hypothetical protein